MKAMDPEIFQEKTRDLKRGALILVNTENSVCVGYFEGFYPKANVAYIVLAGTRKIEQGRDSEDWYDHTYSVPVGRIKAFNKISEI